MTTIPHVGTPELEVTVRAFDADDFEVTLRVFDQRRALYQAIMAAQARMEPADAEVEAAGAMDVIKDAIDYMLTRVAGTA